MMRISLKILLSVYILFLLTGAFTILYYPIFPSLDGPEHLFYSVTLDKLRQGHEFYNKNLYLNDRFVPNAAFDDITIILTHFLNPIEAQKILVFITFIALNISFMLLLSHFTKDRSIILSISSLFVPLTFTFVLYMGFFNFYLGLVFMILSLYLFNKAIKSKSLVDIIILGMMSFMTYYAHFFCFFLYCLIIFLSMSHDFVYFQLIKKKRFSYGQLYVFFISSLIPVMLSLNFIIGLIARRSRGQNLPFITDITPSFFQRIITSFETMGYGRLNGIVTYAAIFLLLAFALYKARHAKSYKYAIVAGVLALIWLVVPTFLLNWYYFKQRFWIPVLILFLIYLTQIRFKKIERVIFIIGLLLLSSIMIYYTEVQISNEYNLIKDLYGELNHIDIEGNSTVLFVYSSSSMSWHIISYYCIEHDCLYQFTWFKEPDTFKGGYKIFMPYVNDGYNLSSWHLVFDYYFFEGSYYKNISSVAQKFNMTKVYESDRWKVYRNESRS